MAALKSHDYVEIDKGLGCLIVFSITQFGVRISNVVKTTSDIQQIKSQPPVPANISDLNPSNMPLLLDHHAIRAEDVRVQIEGS